MKIARILVRKEDLALTRPYTIAYKTVTAVQNVIVEIVADNDLYGLGAGNPSKSVVGESLDDAVAALTETNLAFLIGRDVRHLRQLCAEVAQRFPNNPGARAALDIALHDLFAKMLNVPLVQYLGQKRKAMLTSITIGIKDVPETLAEADEYLGRGFRSIKVKLGTTPEADVERLEKLHAHLHNRARLRVDLNQAYDLTSLTAFFYQTRHLNLELIEQPLKASAVWAMKQLPGEIKRILAADESLVSPKDALELASSPAACGIFNIKLMKAGGITPALEIATVARQAGISLMWGCNDESIISITAALHAALSCPHTKYLDLDGSLDLAKDVVTGGFALREGMLAATGKAGLGVTKIQ